MRRIVEIEARLFLRERRNAVFSLLFSTLLLLVLGSIPGLRTPDSQFGGLRFVDVYAPTLIVITLAFLGLQRVPQVVATYRESGVLRRFATTPVDPARLLVAQMIVNMVAALVSIAITVAVGHLVFGIDLPHHPVWMVLAVALGAAALFGVGLVIAALAPTARAAGGIATVVFMLIMFFGGAYLPRKMLPEVVNRIGEHLPPGVQALQDGWLGGTPQPLHLAIMALVTIVAGTVAARTFRWG
ncbi:transport permease protein [Lentzea sp. NBRC 105346]|uniref:ABC transporter permease n=1 Tax=Lentzea sp. NBRC 105346 TaxID=3032205 RepID=UPI0024A0CBA0|nr:ABC transporter permease [Lentzea sp. NBRC 105346]GLZ33444.1 transport permease protein [Lentzea sp. NBRC 105346]